MKTKPRKQVRLQIPEDLRVKLKDAAKTNGRTFNGEISDRLKDSLQTDVIHEFELLLINTKLLLECGGPGRTPK